MKDFIGIYENAFSDSMCDFLVSHIDDKLDNASTVYTGYIDKPKDLGREDEQFFLGQSSLGDNAIFNDCLSDICKTYTKDVPVLQNLELRSIDNKLQRTKIGGGYHQWHFEQISHLTSKRVVVWTVYLNDVEEGGETEFLYQHTRLKPKKGTAVFFPSSYTHTHRGNPPLSNTKYIATGWYSVV